MKVLLAILLCIGIIGCSEPSGPGNNDIQPATYKQSVACEPDPYEWVPIFRFDGSAGDYCFPDSPRPEMDGTCNYNFNSNAPVFWEGQWCSSNHYKLAFWIWYGWQKECGFGSGSHANDWEHVILNFIYESANDFILKSVTYYQHKGWYTRWKDTDVPEPNVWVGKIGHGSYHTYCKGGFPQPWDVNWCMGGCGYWDDFRNDRYGIHWKPTNLIPLDSAKRIPGPIGDRVKNQDYCDIGPCFEKDYRGYEIGEAFGCWQNNDFLWPKSHSPSAYDAELFYECSGTPVCTPDTISRAITSIYSVHNNDREDRVWTFGCTDLPGGLSTCTWTDYLNWWDQEFTYRAPKDHFISGFASYHCNDHEDRRWKVKICKQEGKYCANCEWTDFLNWWDSELDLQTGDKVIYGIASYHSNYREDRRWRFLLCDLVDTPVPCNPSLSGQVFDINEDFPGIAIDLCDSNGNFLFTAITDQSGSYQFTDIDSGLYTVSILTPLGYQTDQETVTVHIECSPEVKDFYLVRTDIESKQRGRGYWMHQVKALLSNKGHPHETYEAMCEYMELIRIHFNENGLNPVNIFEVDLNADCNGRLEALRATISPKAHTTMNEKARAHLTALLLNIVSGKIAPWAEISEDGATVSQAITFCNSLIADGDPDNDELAKDIAEMINEGQTVPDGWIDPSTPDIVYKQG